MQGVFVETSDFTAWVYEFLTEESYAQLQLELMKAPLRGTVIRGCGGLRKVRVTDTNRGKGKRSGARVIYLYVPEVRQFLMLDIYGKHEQDDLSAAERRVLSHLADEFHSQLLSRRRARPT